MKSDKTEVAIAARFFPVQVLYTEWPYKGQEWQHLTAWHIKPGVEFTVIESCVDLPTDLVSRRVK